MDIMTQVAQMTADLSDRLQPLLSEWTLLGFKIKQLEAKGIDDESHLATLRALRKNDSRRIGELLEEADVIILNPSNLSMV